MLMSYDYGFCGGCYEWETSYRTFLMLGTSCDCPDASCFSPFPVYRKGPFYAIASDARIDFSGF